MTWQTLIISVTRWPHWLLMTQCHTHRVVNALPLLFTSSSSSYVNKCNVGLCECGEHFQSQQFTAFSFYLHQGQGYVSCPAVAMRLVHTVHLAFGHRLSKHSPLAMACEWLSIARCHIKWHTCHSVVSHFTSVIDVPDSPLARSLTLPLPVKCIQPRLDSVNPDGAEYSRLSI